MERASVFVNIFIHKVLDLSMRYVATIILKIRTLYLFGVNYV